MKPEHAAQFVTVALERRDPERVMLVLRQIARARGMATVAAAAGIGRTRLYKLLAPGAVPRFDAVLKIAQAVGLDFMAQPTVSELKLKLAPTPLNDMPLHKKS